MAWAHQHRPTKTTRRWTLYFITLGRGRVVVGAAKLVFGNTNDQVELFEFDLFGGAIIYRRREENLSKGGAGR